jgi:hypothetical protein
MDALEAPVDELVGVPAGAPAGAPASIEEPLDQVLGLIGVIESIHRAQAGLAAVEAELLESARRRAEAEAIAAGAPRELAFRSFRAEVALALNLTERAVDRALGTASSLVSHLPSTLAALHAGRISRRHAEAMVSETIGLDPDELLAVETTALPHAESLTVPKFERKVRTIRERRAPEAAAKRHRAALVGRDVTVTAAPDGMAWLTAYLPAPEAVAIFGRLDATARAIHQGGDPRGVGQLRADIFCQAYLGDRQTVEGLAERFRNIRPTVVVTVPVATMAGGTAPAELEGHGPIDAETAREIASWAPFFRRMITDPVQGVSLDLDRTRYRPNADLRLWLRLRDRTCTHPGCNRSVAASDLDHTKDWGEQGKTRDGNLAHLCRGHHLLKHRMAWKVAQAPDGSGRLTWTSPRGRVYFREPDPPP